MSKVTKIEIDLETLLKALESNYNPNCYKYTGNIRAIFREERKDTVVILSPNKGDIKITRESVDEL